MESKFTEIKSEILKRAKEANACREQYGRAYGSETIQELMQVVKDNFTWAAENRIIDAELITEYANEFNENNIYCNVDVRNGYLLASGNSTVRACGNSTVRASGNSTVRAFDNSTVKAWDNSTVKASGNSTVEAFESSTVRACGNSTVRASGNSYVNTYDEIIECKLSENAIRRVRSTNVIQTANSEIKL